MDSSCACFIFKRTAGNPLIFRISVNHAINEIEERWVSGLLIELCSSQVVLRLHWCDLVNFGGWMHSSMFSKRTVFGSEGGGVDQGWANGGPGAHFHTFGVGPICDTFHLKVWF